MQRPRTIDCNGDVQAGLDWLTANDPRLQHIAAMAGDVPLRRSEPGFSGLVRIIIAQQVSKQSAAAIDERCRRLINPLTPEAYLAASDQIISEIGLSRPKIKALTHLSQAILDGQLDLEQLGHCSVEEAISALTTVKGIGPWTAEVYLMLCVGHADIFPAGDLALQIAAHEALQLDARPTALELAKLAESWSPWRGVAARLLWAWYAAARNREIIP